MLVTVEKGQDNDGFTAAQVVRSPERSGEPASAIIAGPFYVINTSIVLRLLAPPVLRAELWCLFHGHGLPPIVGATMNI